METLGRLGHAYIFDHQFSAPQPGFLYDTVRLTTDSDTSVRCRSQRMTADRLPAFISEALPLSALSLVAIRRHQKECLISRDGFLDVFEACGLGGWTLHLEAHRYHGFHYHTDEKGRTTCYMGTVLYTLMWCTVASETQADCDSVRVLVVTRDSSSHGRRGRETLEELVATLQDTTSNISQRSWMPFAVALDMVKWLEICLQRDLDRTRETESNTGHGILRRGRGGYTSRSLASIEQWSKEVSATLIKSADHYRHAESVAALLLFIQETSGLPGSFSRPMDDMATAVSVLQRHISSLKTTLQYIQDRLKSQATVVSNEWLFFFFFFSFSLSRAASVQNNKSKCAQLSVMLTHADAQASLELTQASLELAKASIALADAAKRDSSSMKTVAIMTMGFLPATFFAALFALPSLQWDHPDGHIVQPSFGIYWAFTLPATGLIFAAWYLSTRKEAGGGNSGANEMPSGLLGLQVKSNDSAREA